MTMGDAAANLPAPEPTTDVAELELKNPAILKALRANENPIENPTLKNPTSTAGGLYQYTDPTWRTQAPLAGVDIKQYPTARSAPAELQHKVADENVSRILEENNGDVRAVPHMWYAGNPQGNLTQKQLDANKSRRFPDGMPQSAYDQMFLSKLGDGQAATPTASSSTISTPAPIKVAMATGLAPKTASDQPAPWETLGKKILPDSVPTDSSFWVPLIAGLGSMLASNQYRFSQRLGEGLIGGAAAYGKQQEFGLQQQQQKQQAAQNAALIDIKKQELGITSTTSGINALKFLQSRYLPKYDAANNIIGYKDTTGGTDISVQDFQKMMQQASSSLQNAAPGASILNTLGGQIGKAGQPSGATQPPASAQPAVGAQPLVDGQPIPGAQAPAVSAPPAVAASASVGPNGPTVDMSKPETLQNRIDWLTDRIAEIGASNPSLTAARQSELQKLQNQQSELLKLSPEMTALAAKRKAAEEGAQTSVKSQYAAKDAAAANAQLASTLVQQSNQMLDTMFDPKTGKPVVSTGPIGPEIARVAGIAKQLGVDPDLINKFTNAEKSQEIEKLAIQMATEIGRQTLGAQNPMRQAEFMQFLKSVPSLGISAEAFRDIVNNTILPQSRMQIERWKHVSDMDPAEKNIQKELLQYELKNPWYVPKTIPSDPSQRIVDQVYESNGKRAKWTGSGWDVGQ
jgi:hypothetical protein